MYHVKSKPGSHYIDHQWVHTDSLMEAVIITQLVENGFSLKWRRSKRGISFGYARYTPDVELCVDYQGHSVRAIVEFKAQSATEFTKKSRLRMLTSMRYYSRAIPLLFVYSTKQWYEIGKDTNLIAILPPKPGLLNISQLSRPRIFVPVSTTFGHSYSALPTPLLMSKMADGLEFGVHLMFGSPKSYRKARRARRK